MLARCKRASAGVIAALALLALAAPSDASRFQISETAVRFAFRSLEFAAGASTVRCAVTLEGSFHSVTISKVNEALIGHVTRASIGTCSGGAATVLAETLPWHLRYGGFGGTLPNITSVTTRLIGASLRLQPTGLTVCLARSTVGNPVTLLGERARTGEITGARAGGIIPLEGFLCEFAGEATLGGTGTVTVLGGTTPIGVFLEEVSPIFTEEGNQNLPPIEIPRANVVETVVMRNKANIATKIKAIFTLGANDEKFRIRTEEARACRNELVVEPGRMCNVIVEYVGPPNPRMQEFATTVVIQSAVGNALVTARFVVTAK